MSCYSQASLHNQEHRDVPPSPISCPPSLHIDKDEEHIGTEENIGLMNATVATVEYRAPPTDLNPSVTDVITTPHCPSPRPIVSPTGAEISVLQTALSTEPPLKPSHGEDVQPPSATVEEDVPNVEVSIGVLEVHASSSADNEVVQNQQASITVLEVPQQERHTDLTASASAVNVIPLDCHSPEATINAPEAVKRYLTRWPRGNNEPAHPVFDNTNLHDFRTMHNNQGDDERRAALAQIVPSHVKVSDFHPCLKINSIVSTVIFRHFHFSFIYHRVVLGSG